jgi:hypothetical protein
MGTAAMQWTHAPTISIAEQGTAMVVEGDDGWEALPFGSDGGAAGVLPTRQGAIDIVESILGDMVCCVGHLAADSDD